MRTRLCNAADEAKLLDSVKSTAIKETDVKTIENELGEKNDTYKIEESTNHLSDRLKDAGDNELLEEDKEGDTAVQEDGEKPIDDNEISEAKTNEEVGVEVHNRIKNEAGGNEDDIEKISNGNNKVEAKADVGNDETVLNCTKKSEPEANVNDLQRIRNDCKNGKAIVNESGDTIVSNYTKKNGGRASDDDVGKLKKSQEVIANGGDDEKIRSDLKKDTVKFQTSEKEDISLVNEGNGLGISEGDKKSMEMGDIVLL